MKKTILALWLLLPLCSAVAQTEDTGLILDEVAYSKVPKLADFEFSGSKYEELPTEFSLKPYCPEPNQQGKIGSCVFQSLSYGAMTVMYAAQNHITDKTKIGNIKFSALYGFNQLSTNCLGIRFSPALEFLKTKGTLFFNDFEANDALNCRKLPTVAQHQKAFQYRIKSAARIFDTQDDRLKKIHIIKKCIATNTPVIAGMAVTESFKTCKGQPEYYDSAGDVVAKHAMVIIGYDEYSFELLNSLGSGWGNSGYVKIKYEHFFKYFREGYTLVFEKREMTVLLAGHLQQDTLAWAIVNLELAQTVQHRILPV